MSRIAHALALVGLAWVVTPGSARAQVPCPTDSVAAYASPAFIDCHGNPTDPAGQGECPLFCTRMDCLVWSEWDHPQGAGSLGVYFDSGNLTGFLAQRDRFTVTHTATPGFTSLQPRLLVTLHLIGTHAGGLAGDGRARVRLEMPGGPVEWDPGPLTVGAGQALDLTHELLASPISIEAGSGFDLRWSLEGLDVTGHLQLRGQLTFVESPGAGVELTSCRGFAGVVPVRSMTWGAIKAQYR